MLPPPSAVGLLLLPLLHVSTAGLSVAGPSAAPDATAMWQVCDVTKHGAIGDNKVPTL